MPGTRPWSGSNAFFAVEREDLAQLGDLADIAVERRFGETALQLERLWTDLEPISAFVAAIEFSIRLLRIGVDLVVERLGALAGRIRGLYVGLDGFLAVAQKLVVVLDCLFESLLRASLLFLIAVSMSSRR